MPQLTKTLAPKVVWVLPLAGVLLAGCDHRGTPDAGGPAPTGSVAAQQQQAQIQAIQNNPRLPAATKAAAVQSLQAHGGGVPK